MNSGFDKNPSAALRFRFLHCGVALFMPPRVLRLVRKAQRALHLELFSNPMSRFASEVLT